MQEHKQIQLYVGLEEGGCVDVGAIKLDGFTLIATSELEALKVARDALLAQAEVLRAALEATRQPHMDYIPTLDKTAKQILDATPQQCLLDVKAEAGRAGWLACLDKAVDYFDSYYAGMLTDADADKYADTIRQGGA